MLVETAMSIATPWPLKIIIDNVVGKHPLPEFLAWLRDLSVGEHTMALAGVAAFGAAAIALIGALAGYIDNYYTESVALYVANDLRHRLYHHLRRLSPRYCDNHQIGNMLSTITSDVGERLSKVARHDWEHSHPLDLTDEGLFTDVEKSRGSGAEKLVLRMDDEHAKKHKM